MAVTEFRSEVINGPVESSAVTITMIADDQNVALFGPVVLADASITDLPHAASTTTAGNTNAFGVCVKLPRSGSITAHVSVIEVCILGYLQDQAYRRKRKPQ